MVWKSSKMTKKLTNKKKKVYHKLINIKLVNTQINVCGLPIFEKLYLFYLFISRPTDKLSLIYLVTASYYFIMNQNF